MRNSICFSCQHATVLQLPATPTRSEAEAQTRASVNEEPALSGLGRSIISSWKQHRASLYGRLAGYTDGSSCARIGTFYFGHRRC
jgi:hypothetical protein